MNKKGFVSILVSMFVLVGVAACGGGGGGGDPVSAGDDFTASLTKLSDQDYQALSEEERFAVSNKVTGTLFKGVATDEFFDLSAGLQLALVTDDNYLNTVEQRLLQSVNLGTYRNRVNQKYEFDSKQRAIQYQLALLYEVPLSKTYFDIWMAYVLANTILFSPAVELDTVAYEDAERVFERLLSMIRNDRSVRDIVYEHMISQENWRRFRSPEDNAREMLEIFLQRFIDAEVPLAAQACQNWSLEKQDDEHILVIGSEGNSEPLDVLDTSIVDCYDFYRAVAGHADLLPAVVATIVDIFFYGYPRVNKVQIVGEIMTGDPVTFREIFRNILFSKEYLLNVDRPKTFEETFLSLAWRMDWFAKRTFFKNLNRVSTSSTYPGLVKMKQASMVYKLGKPRAVPLDSLSFAYYHKAVRELLLIDRKSNETSDNDGGWQNSFIEVNLTGDEFIDYLFMSVVSRPARQSELDELNAIIAARGYNRDNRKMQQAMIVLDYLSRLSELYFTRVF